MTWEVVETDENARKATAITKKIEGTVGSTSDGSAQKLRVTLHVPKEAKGRVPVLLNLSFFSGEFPRRRGGNDGPPPFDPIAEVLSHGWAFAQIGYNDIQPDRPNQFEQGVIGLTLQEGQTNRLPTSGARSARGLGERVVSSTTWRPTTPLTKSVWRSRELRGSERPCSGLRRRTSELAASSVSCPERWVPRSFAATGEKRWMTWHRISTGSSPAIYSVGMSLNQGSHSSKWAASSSGSNPIGAGPICDPTTACASNWPSTAVVCSSRNRHS